MLTKIRLGKKSQIVIPRKIRNALKIKEGDELLIELIKNKIIISQKPVSYSHTLKGLYKEIWLKQKSDAYIKNERDSWAK